MDYKKLYAEKLVSAEKAASVVKSGDWVDYGWTTGTPVAVDAAIAKRLPELENVNFRGGILMWVPEIFKIENPAEHMTWNSWHMSGIERKAVSEGFSYYIPLRYSELPGYYRNCIKTLDVAMFQVAPMDAHGWFNFGPGGSHLKAVCECAKTVIVEVNKNMPVCLGGFENCVHINDVDMIVEGENPALDELGGGSAASYAIRYAAGFEGMMMVLSGMSSMEQMEENIRFMKDFKPLNDRELAAIDKVREIYHGMNLIPCTACRYCVAGCPKHISIPDLLAVMNTKQIHHDWNADFYYNNVYTGAGRRASDCIQCGRCEKACPQHLPIRRLLTEIAAEFDKQ